MTARIRKALVTGGGGFIGTALIRQLLDEGIEVHNLDFIPNSIQSPLQRHFQGSFLDHGLTREALSGADCVFHLAATGFSREANVNPLRDAQENILGTLALLDYAVESGAKRVVFCSSGGTVYGPTDAELIDEGSPTNPISAYGVSKLSCEKYMRLYNGRNASDNGGTGLSTITVRVANPYGAGQNINKAQGALTTFCHRAVNQEPIEIWGDGTIERDYIEVRDVATALISAARAHDVSGTEINIGSGRGSSLNELLSEIEAALGQPLLVTYQPGRSFDVAKNVLNISRAKALLGWQPNIELRDGIRSLLADLKAR